MRKAGLEPPPVGLPMLVRQAMVRRQIQQKIDLGRSVQRQLKERKLAMVKLDNTKHAKRQAASCQPPPEVEERFYEVYNIPT